MNVNPLIAEHCVCPTCHGELRWSTDGAECRLCLRRYRCVDGIPLFAEPELGCAEPGAAYKQAQASFFDAQPDDWETTRPRGAPRLYGWLMSEKFSRSVAGLESLLPGAVTLTVCGGSGMDAEFLARAGARVIASDISLGAARRAQERSRRHGVPIAPIVADAEALPFRTGGAQIAYVHDGLHHLEDPLKGLREMIRVGRRAIAVTEPAQAFATRVAVRLGISELEEEAGNRVQRVDREEIVGALEAGGLEVIGAERYAMYYRHEPGPAVRLLSTPGLFGSARGAFRLANITLGPIGNKLSVRAVKAIDPADQPVQMTAIGGPK